MSMCSLNFFAAVWSVPEKFWSIFVSDTHHTKYIFSLLIHCVRHKGYMSKINPKPIDLQNGKRTDSWCKYYLFLFYSGTCLGLSKQFSTCYLRVFFKTPVVFLFSLIASLLVVLFNDLHTIATFSAMEKLHGLNAFLPLHVIFEEELPEGELLVLGHWRGWGSNSQRCLRCLCSSYSLTDYRPCMVTRTELRFCITVFQCPH